MSFCRLRGRLASGSDQGIKNLEDRTAFISTNQPEHVSGTLGQKARQPPELRGSQPPFTLPRK